MEHCEPEGLLTSINIWLNDWHRDVGLCRDRGRLSTGREGDFRHSGEAAARHWSHERRKWVFFICVLLNCSFFLLLVVFFFSLASVRFIFLGLWSTLVFGFWFINSSSMISWMTWYFFCVVYFISTFILFQLSDYYWNLDELGKIILDLVVNKII